MSIIKQIKRGKLQYFNDIYHDYVDLVYNSFLHKNDVDKSAALTLDIFKTLYCNIIRSVFVIDDRKFVISCIKRSMLKHDVQLQEKYCEFKAPSHIGENLFAFITLSVNKRRKLHNCYYALSAFILLTCLVFFTKDMLIKVPSKTVLTSGYEGLVVKEISSYNNTKKLNMSVEGVSNLLDEGIGITSIERDGDSYSYYYTVVKGELDKVKYGIGKGYVPLIGSYELNRHTFKNRNNYVVYDNSSNVISSIEIEGDIICKSPNRRYAVLYNNKYGKFYGIDLLYLRSKKVLGTSSYTVNNNGDFIKIDNTINNDININDTSLLSYKVIGHNAVVTISDMMQVKYYVNNNIIWETQLPIKGSSYINKIIKSDIRVSSDKIFIILSSMTNTSFQALSRVNGELINNINDFHIEGVIEDDKCSIIEDKYLLIGTVLNKINPSGLIHKTSYSNALISIDGKPFVVIDYIYNNIKAISVDCLEDNIYLYCQLDKTYLVKKYDISS